MGWGSTPPSSAKLGVRQSTKMTQAEAGKGSAQRRRQISDDEWNSRWDAIFSRDLKENKDERELQETQESIAGHDGQDHSR